MPDDEQKPPLKFIIDGGVAPRRKAKSQTPAPHSDSTEIFECLICDTKQIESRSPKFRAARVRCRHCGRTAYPVEEVLEKVVPVRKCKVCGSRLRSSNSTTRCSSCGDR